MNRYEVEEAAARYAQHPVLGPATRTLHNLMDWTDANSDGWAYWPKPVRAADKLMTLIEGEDRAAARFDRERADATPAKLAAALRPVKAFRTRQNADFEVAS
jgi:hypothetical protein